MAKKSNDQLKWTKVPQFPRAHYEVDVFWHSLERQLVMFGEGCGLNTDPDYQREHVWTEAQQQAYVEYILQGGEVGRNITWNADEWPMPRGPLELVDGKQRLEAVRRFIRGELVVFNMRYVDGDVLRIYSSGFKFRVCSLDRAGVLRLYLNINAGGTPHTSNEISRVRALLEDEEKAIS